ncbi:hypothetical protein [Aquibacillus sediminis]|uniref:hypothetical protein n=1 Tax=Aquibacillus sediminis TaxID=2574734 RepID=UPI001107B3CB|nr:hypothetical protein [Aquibacillus sediminis]
MRKLKTVIYITVGIFILLSLISFIFTSRLNRGVIGLGGTIIGFILILPSIKIHRLIFFGSRVNHADVIIPDEHLQHKVYEEYGEEEDENTNPKYKMVINLLGYSGGLIIIISMFIVPL